MSELFYVVRNGHFHRGPGRVFTQHIFEASLYPEALAQSIAQRYGSMAVQAVDYIEDLKRQHKTDLEELVGILREIRTGARTYVKVTEQLVSIFEMEEDIRELPDGSLKNYLMELVEQHKIESGISSQGAQA